MKITFLLCSLSLGLIKKCRFQTDILMFGEVHSGKISGYRGGGTFNSIARVISRNVDFTILLSYATFQSQISKRAKIPEQICRINLSLTCNVFKSIL